MVHFCTERKFFMKHNKLFAVLTMAAVMTLAACGGKTDSKASAAPGKVSSKAPTVTSKEPPKPVKAAQIDEVKLTKKEADGKVYVQFKGSETLYTAADKLQYAFGISSDAALPEAGEDGTVSSANFVYGKAAPEAADFKDITFTPAADASKVEFTFEYCITDIADIPVDVYHFFGGFTAAEYDVIEFEPFTGRDAKYDYFMRDDQSSTGLAIEDLGPFAITEASVVKLAATDLPAPAEGAEQTLPAGLYAKIGGTQATAYTQEQLNAWNTHCDFQRCTGGYRKNALNNFFWKVESGKVYIYMSVAEFAAGETYMTHIAANAKAGSGAERNPGKALPSAAILTNNVYSFAEENLKITVIGDPTKGQDDGEEAFYGALGFQIDYVVAPEAPAEGE